MSIEIIYIYVGTNYWSNWTRPVSDRLYFTTITGLYRAYLHLHP